MIPQNRVGIGGLFLFHFYKTHQIAPKRLFIQKYKLLKKIAKGRFQIKSFIIIFSEIVIKNLGSRIQMVGKPKILADNPKCRAWLYAGQFLFQT